MGDFKCAIKFMYMYYNSAPLLKQNRGAHWNMNTYGYRDAYWNEGAYSVGALIDKKKFE